MATWSYELGATRWRKHSGKYDVRCHEAPKGWSIEVMILDEHPVTGKPFKRGQWWIKETYTGEAE